MKQPVIMIGVGEMGGVFARGFLKLGHPVHPLTKQIDIAELQQKLPAVETVVVAVGEKDLNGILTHVPKQWSGKLILLQNELLPKDWQEHHIGQPTVISIWFEKKHPSDYKVIIPSPVFGPKSLLVQSALETLKIPCRVLSSPEDLVFELVVKNLYILTINIAGLVTAGTVETLWNQHNALAREVADDILDIQFALIGKTLNRDKLIEAMVKAFEGDWQHKCLGRSAPDRLKRALEQADQAGLKVKRLRAINAQPADSK